MDRKLRISLEVLLAAESQEEDTQNLSLADPETIKEALQERPLNLNTFQADVSELLNAWYQDVFAKRKPALVRLKYGEERGELPFDEVSPQDNDNENTPPFDDDEDGEGKQRLKTPAELREMRKARKTLQERAIDPLPESYEVATGAAPAPRKRSAREEDLEEESSVDSPSPKRSRSSKAGFYGRPKKKTARVEFDDSDEEEEELSEVRLSDIPQHHNYSNNSPAKIEGQRSAASRTSSGPKQRQKFSPEEKRAIREGVLKFGEGKWARIKSEYAAILQNRTNVNIKVSCGHCLESSNAGIGVFFLLTVD